MWQKSNVFKKKDFVLFAEEGSSFQKFFQKAYLKKSIYNLILKIWQGMADL